MTQEEQEEVKLLKELIADKSISADEREIYEDALNELMKSEKPKATTSPSKPTTTQRKARTTPTKKVTPAKTKQTATDVEKAKAEIKAKTGKTEAECESIIEQYRALRTKAQEGKRKAEQASADNKERVGKLERKGDIIAGTNEKTADAVIESSAKDVAEKIEKEVGAVEAKAEKEAKSEVAKDKSITSAKDKKEAVEAIVDEQVKKKTQTIVKRVVIDTSALLTSIATSLGKFDKDSQKEFLIKLRSDIDKLISKYAFGGMTDGATQVMNIQQSNMSSSSVNPSHFGEGGNVGGLDLGVYRVGKPKKVSPNFYEQKIVEIFENGDISTASDYGKKLSDFKSQKYPIITQQQLDNQYKYYAKGGGVRIGSDGREYPYGSAWKLEHNKNNKNEDYEVPASKRKYSVGGTLLSGMIGAYVGYQYGKKGKKAFKFEDGGVIGQEIVFDDSGEENMGVIKDITNAGDYIVLTNNGRSVLAQRDRDVISLGAMAKAPMMEAPRKRFGFFEDGGGVDNPSRQQMLDYLNMYFDYYSELRTIVVEEDNILTRRMLKSLDDEELEIAYDDAKYEIKADTQFVGGGGVDKFEVGENSHLSKGQKNRMYLDDSSMAFKQDILENISASYGGISIKKVENEVYDDDAEMLYEYITNDNDLRKKVYLEQATIYSNFKRGGGVHTMPDGRVMLNSAHYSNGGGVATQKARVIDYYINNADNEDLITLIGVRDFPNLIGVAEKWVNNRDTYYDKIFNAIDGIHNRTWGENKFLELGLEKFADGGGVESEWVVKMQNEDSGDIETINVLAKTEDEAVENALNESSLSSDYTLYSVNKKYAQGGMTEHGLRVGDRIKADGKTFGYKDEIQVIDSDKKRRFVNLDKGNRGIGFK